jgi:Ca2+-binding EF-hand superfamily protein
VESGEVFASTKLPSVERTTAAQIYSSKKAISATASTSFSKSVKTLSSAKKISGPRKIRQVDPRDPSGRFAFEFERIDKNKDGWLSPAELHQGLLAAGWDQNDVCGLFDLIDLNKDGQITKDEFIAHRVKSGQEVNPKDPTGFLGFEFDRIDKNKDGSLSLSELHQGLLSAGWGQVCRIYYSIILIITSPYFHIIIKQDDVCRLFDLIDANRDGMITKDEYIHFKSASFI